MKFARWAVILSALPLLLITKTLAVDWPPVTPDELKMTAEPLAPGAPAIICTDKWTVMITRRASITTCESRY